MSDRKPAEHPGCRDFLGFVHALDAGELAEEDRKRLEAHRDACPTCRGRHEVERSFERILRARLARAEAPADLEGRIRFRLRQETRRAPARTGFVPRSSYVSAVAASLLVAVALLPALLGEIPAPTAPAAAASVVPVVREAVIVDLICDEHGRSTRMQLACDAPGHLNALKLADGTYWGVLADDGPGRGIVWDRASRGRRVVVEGNLYPAIHTLQLIRVKDSGRGRNAPA